MQRTLADLKYECKNLGLDVTQSGKREAKKDYIKALQKHFWPENPTPGFLWRMSIDSPQLAFLFTNLREEELKDIYESENYTFEKKENGVRMLIHYSPECGFEAYSRNLSVTDYLPVPYHDKIWWKSTQSGESWRSDFSFALDCEIVSIDPYISTVMGKRGVVTETVLQAVAALLALNAEDSVRIQKEMDQPLRLRAFDCLMLDGVDLRKEPYQNRRAALNQVMKITELGLEIVQKVKSVRIRKEDYLNMIWDEGGEGVIAKPIDMPYLDKDSRPRKGWIKIKRTVSGALGDTIDGYVTGFEPGKPEKGFENLVGALHVTLILEDEEGNQTEHMIARVPNISFLERERMTELVNGKPMLKEEYYGQVVEVEGQSISARAKRLVHPRLIRFRTDKAKFECVMQEADLLRQIV